jgi:hypothetical protein
MNAGIALAQGREVVLLTAAGTNDNILWIFIIWLQLRLKGKCRLLPTNSTPLSLDVYSREETNVTPICLLQYTWDFARSSLFRKTPHI